MEEQFCKTIMVTCNLCLHKFELTTDFYQHDVIVKCPKCINERNCEVVIDPHSKSKFSVREKID